MTLATLAVCLTLIAYLAGVGIGSPVALALLRTARGTADPESRARRLFAARLLPAVLGIVVALGLVLPSFLRLEPAQSAEPLGAGLAIAGGLAALVVVAGVVRGALGLVGTRRLVRDWARRARPVVFPGIGLPAFRVDEGFPIVAMTGCFWPRLYVSESVLRHCTRDELEAILSHEIGHLRRGDTWKRLLLRACPDLFALTPLGARIEGLWTEAAEHAADDHAAAPGRARAMDLASALIRVARLGGSGRLATLPLATLYRGGGVADRVSRLLEQPPPALERRERPSRAGVLLLAVAGLLGPVAVGLGASYPVHRALEAVVRLLS